MPTNLSHRFAGLALGGGKNDRTSVAVIEFFPGHSRVFLRSLHERIRADHLESADEKLYQILASREPNLVSVGVDAPLQLPKCLRCALPCPGYDQCHEPEIRWHWRMHAQMLARKKKLKLFTPYTERCSEVYISSCLEEPFHPAHALGANLAPLTARALFIARRLELPLFEVLPELTLWRVGRALKVAKSHLRHCSHSFEGDESRHHFLKILVEREIAFLYQQDIRTMIENSSAFEAFLCALTGFLRFRNQVERRPKDFPRGEAWIEFPKTQIQWFER